jgi:hypothetical protein
VQNALSDAQSAFQGRIGACHGKAGGAVDDAGGTLAKGGRPSPAQLEQYAGALAPCVAAEVAGIGALLADVHTLLPRAAADIKAATPAGVPILVEGGGKKGGGWFGRA